MKSNLVDVTVRNHYTTDRAVLVSTTGHSSDAVWVPLSQCEIVMSSPSGQTWTMTLEEDLAVEKGLV